MLCSRTLPIMIMIIATVMLADQYYAYGTQTTSVSAYLNNTLLHGQALPSLQAPSSIEWRINTTFYGSGNVVYANLGWYMINYSDYNGISTTATNDINVTWHAGPVAATFPINSSVYGTVNMISSNILLGSVSQSGIFSSATAAPACSTNNLYSEWDFYVTVQKNSFTSSQNVVVGRVCFYQETVGYAHLLYAQAYDLGSSSMLVKSGGVIEPLLYAPGSENASSPDGMVSAHFSSSSVSPSVQLQDMGSYMAFNSPLNGSWYVHSNSTYDAWYSQFYSFTAGRIPATTLFYSPTNVGLVSPDCSTVSTSNLTNKSVEEAVQCMNQTASVYYSRANSYAIQLTSTSRSISGYPTQGTLYLGKPAIAVMLPGSFTQSANATLFLNGAFTGVTVHSAVPAIISISSTQLNFFGVGSIIAQVLNTGSGPGLFSASISDCPGISAPSGLSYQLGQGAGEKITIGIMASGYNGIIDQTCTVTFTDLKSGESSSTQVNVSSGIAERIYYTLAGLFSSLFH